MNEIEPAVLRQKCVVKVYRGIPIKNNEYKQYVNLKTDELIKICNKYYDKSNLY